MKVLHRKVLLKVEVKVERGVRLVRLFAFLLCFLCGVSEHVELLTIKSQYLSPFIINPCVLGSFPVPGSSYILGSKKKSS